jgi:hypothetical protein
MAAGAPDAAAKAPDAEPDDDGGGLTGGAVV